MADKITKFPPPKPRMAGSAEGWIPVQRSVLRGLLILAAHRDIRFYINSINVEVEKTGITLVATDGHRMGAYRLKRPENVSFPQSFIVSRELIEAVRSKHGEAWLRFDSALRTVTIACDDLSHSCMAIEATYPQWRRVIPRKVEPAQARFNSSYVHDFTLVAQAFLGGSNLWDNVRIAAQKDSGALVTIHGVPEFVGVLMPMRASDTPLIVEPPAWAAPPEEPKQAAATLNAVTPPEVTPA
ncbi:MAG: hypothetical protein AB7G13_11675 [Lautropia sp.]